MLTTGGSLGIGAAKASYAAQCRCTPKAEDFGDMSLDSFRNIDINIIGTFLCTREALKIMSPRNGGTGGARTKESKY